VKLPLLLAKNPPRTKKIEMASTRRARKKAFAAEDKQMARRSAVALNSVN
jgi:hypothetical protein